MKYTVLCAAICAAAASAEAAFTGITNYWVGAEWADYNDASNWRVGDPESGVCAVPSANDMIMLDSNTTYAFDMGGKTNVVAQILGTANNSGSGKGTVQITNGALRVEGLYSKEMKAVVWDGGLFAFGNTDVFFNSGIGGTCQHRVKSGGTLDIKALSYQGYYLTVETGGRANLLANRIITHPGPASSNNSSFDIYGSFNAERGFTFSDPPYWNPSSGADVPTRFTVFPGGTLSLGGAVIETTSRVGLHFLFKGGALAATGDVKFQNVSSFVVEDGAELECNVAEGASLKMPAIAQYGAGSVLKKTGDGALVVDLESSIPAVCEVEGGSVLIEKPDAVLRGWSFAEGTELKIFADGTRVDSPVDYDGISVSVDPDLLKNGFAVLHSDDAGFLTAVASSLAASLPSDYKAVVSGDAVVFWYEPDNTFDASKSSDLSDASAWKYGSVPQGQAVVISGIGSVCLGADTPRFSSITVQNGAEVSVEGGTLDAPVDLPPVTLSYDARLKVESGAFAQSTNGLVCSGDALTLPVLEIATNATLSLRTPNLPNVRNTANDSGSIADTGFRLSNVDLRWYGQIRMTTVRTNSNVLAQAVFGWAGAGDTTYLSVDCRGGTLYRLDTHNNADLQYTPMMVVYPDAGGVVKTKGTLLFMDFRREGDGIYVKNGAQFGRNNPSEVDIPVVIDGSSYIGFKGRCMVAGGVDLVLKGPAGWYYDHDFYNDYGWPRRFEIRDAAKISVEDGAVFSSTPSYGSYYGFGNYGAGGTSFAAKNAYIGIWTWVGDGRSAARVEDSYLLVGQLYPDAPGNSLKTQTPFFSGFSAVEVPENSTMWVVATNIWRGESSGAAWTGFVRDWNRVSLFGPPVIGGGDLAVSNGLTGAKAAYSMTAVVTNGANLATGEAWASPPSAAGALSYLLFNDGANWAGTVVANGYAGLTNTVAAAEPSSVSFGTIRFDGNFPVRVWKAAGGAATNDVVDIAAEVSGTGGFTVVCEDGYVPETGDRFMLGRYPAGAVLPAVHPRGWRLRPKDTGDGNRLELVYLPEGFRVIVR